MRKVIRFLRRAARRRELRQRAAASDPLAVVLGAGATQYPGWLNTDRDLLDLCVDADWARLFAPASLDRLLCEHVLEHLTLDRNRLALTNCFRYLKPGGRLRIAVPDGNRRDSVYRAEVTPPRDGHELLFTLESLSALLGETGFRVQPLEWFDESDHFHARAWNPEDGMILRSRRFDRQPDFRREDLFYTSLIVDAVKP